MKKTMQFTGLVLLVFSTIASGMAQGTTAATYKAKCQMCHGATGMAETAAGKSMKVKPVSDPAVKKMTEAQMIAATKNGMGKMQAYKDSLSEKQIQDLVTYFRGFMK